MPRSADHASADHARTRVRLGALAVAVTLATAHCGPRDSGGPHAVLRRYIAAIEANRPDDAYRLLDPSVRREITREQFAASWHKLKPELATQARQLRRQLGQPIKIVARVTYPGPTRARLHFSSDRWHIEQPVSVTLRATTPSEALEALARAVEQRNYEAVMSLLAASVRDKIEKDIEKRLGKLRSWIAAGGEIEIKGDRARAPYDPRHGVDLVKEDGQWRVVDFE